jgi:hypothetical protein
MARDLTAGAEGALDDAIVRPVFFYEGEFNAGTLRLWTGFGSKSWNSQTWLGAGSLLGVSPITETSDLRATGVTLSLSGMSSEVIAIVLGQARLGKLGKLWLGFLNADGTIIADPYFSFKGKLDVPSFVDEGKVCTVSITYENHLIDLDRAPSYRWTHETQLALHPGSLGFQYQSQQADVKLIF